jgi:hypothetical protein
MDKGPWALRLWELITHRNPVRLNPDIVLGLKRLAGKSFLKTRGIIQIYRVSGSNYDNFWGGVI